MTRRLRAPAAALGVGALLGLVIAGGGSRGAMRLIALADDREDFGLPTEGGDIVGEVTLEGTFVVLFTGVVLGIVGAFLYLALRRWLPERALFRTLCFALIILGFGLTATIDGNDADFEFVNTGVSILGFACVLLVYGLLVPILIDRLSPNTVSGSRWDHGMVAAVLVLSLVSGALAVRHAFEIADGAVLISQAVAASMSTRSSVLRAPVRRSSSSPGSESGSSPQLRCEGVNFLLADGEAAGQEIFHVHLHVFPRHAGDGFELRFSPNNSVRPRIELDQAATALARAWPV